MANAAILVGNADYRNLPKLECCREDVRKALDEIRYGEGIVQTTNLA